MNKIYDHIYKTDSKSKTRIWYMEQEGDKYRTWDGSIDGKIKCSEWRVAEPTNVGRSNERNGIEQATFEIEAKYKTKLEKDYHTSIDSIDEGSHIFEVMLADKYKSNKFEVGYAQPKLDGYRCIIDKNGMWSRSGKPFVSSPHIFNSLEHLFRDDPNMITDGELYNHILKDNFNEIQSLINTKSDKSLTPEHFKKTRAIVQYHIYDLPSASGIFSERLQKLNDIFMFEPINNDYIEMVETKMVSTEEQYDELHGIWLVDGYEGSMWRKNDIYYNKRTKSLQKRKEFNDEEFEVVEIVEGAGNWSGVAKSVVCKNKQGKQFGAGIKGTREFCRTLLHEKHKVVTVKYFQLTPDGIPRFGVATKFHGDKRES
jgi:DNA ligase-1